MGFARRVVRKSVRKATPRSVRKAMHPVRTAKNAVSPRSVKQVRRGIYTVRNPLGAAENALIGSVLNAGSGRRRSSGSGGRSSAASLPVALPGGVFVGTGVRAGEARRSADQLASLMAVQRDRFAPAVRPQVSDPIPPDRVAMQKAFWERLGTARPSFWQRQRHRARGRHRATGGDEPAALRLRPAVSTAESGSSWRGQRFVDVDWEDNDDQR